MRRLQRGCFEARGFCLAVIVAMRWLAGAASPLHAGDAAFAQYRERLEQLAAECDSQGQSQDASAIRAWAVPRDAQCFYPVLEDALVPLPAAKPGDASAAARFAALRRERAEELFAHAAKSAADRALSDAYQALWQVLRENPDHAAARQTLGYQFHDGAWRTRFETERLRSGQVWHARFGWLKEDRVARYEAGERFYSGRWTSAERETALRAEMSRGWQVLTEHYSVRTNHSLEAGVQLATRLERLQQVWRQLFLSYYASPVQLKEAFSGRPLVSPVRRLQIVYYRDRAEYLRELRDEAAQIEITTGIYLGDQETAYFFAAEEEDIATQYHEATHQLFGESRPTAQGVGRDRNFWIVEGVACYMESLRQRDGIWIVGGLDSQRVMAARQRLVDDKFYVPLEELSTFGMLDLQQNPQIRSIYSQSTGLTQFLLHGLDGKNREPTIEYLRAVYTGRDRESTLSELTETEYAELDRQYARFIDTVTIGAKTSE